VQTFILLPLSKVSHWRLGFCRWGRVGLYLERILILRVAFWYLFPHKAQTLAIYLNLAKIKELVKLKEAYQPLQGRI